MTKKNREREMYLFLTGQSSTVVHKVQDLLLRATCRHFQNGSIVKDYTDVLGGGCVLQFHSLPNSTVEMEEGIAANQLVSAQAK